MSLISAVSTGANALAIGNTAISLVGASVALVKPKNPPPGIEGFLFDIPETETIKLQAQITNHFVESNFAVSDHIAFDPITITLTGIVAELVLSKSEAEDLVQSALESLKPFGLLSPALSASAQKYISQWYSLKSAVNKAIGQVNSLAAAVGFKKDLGRFGTVGDTRTKQQMAYDTLTQLYYGRSLLHVETPWRKFGPRAEVASPFVIESLEFSQDADTKEMSRVTVTLREFRTISTTAGKGQLASRAVSQAAPVAAQGKAKTKDASILLIGGRATQ